MFVLLGIAVSLDWFLLLYCLLSMLVETVWRSLRPLHVAHQSVATILFGLRILPLVASLIITFALVLPSFQLMEPLPTHEGMGAIPLALGICALLLIACGFCRAIAAQTRTTRAVTCWLEGARPLQVNANSTVTFQSRQESPPLSVVGVRHPIVLVSESTVTLLTPDELRMALKHELEHMKSRDNLKRLILLFVPFPAWPSWRMPGRKPRNSPPMMRPFPISVKPLTWPQPWSSFLAWSPKRFRCAAQVSWLARLASGSRVFLTGMKRASRGACTFALGS